VGDAASAGAARADAGDGGDQLGVAFLGVWAVVGVDHNDGQQVQLPAAELGRAQGGVIDRAEGVACDEDHRQGQAGGQVSEW
jgi:hypothetical protein